MSSPSKAIIGDMASTKIRREENVTLSYLLLTKSNYSVWALKMRVNLQAQGVWEAVEQDEVEECKDRMTLAAIYQALPEDVLLIVAEKDSAKLAWETLKTMHVGVERVKEAKVNPHEGRRDGIRSLGEKMEEISVVKKFLRAVPQKYMQIVTAIEQFGDLKNMTVEEVVGRLKVHKESGGNGGDNRGRGKGQGRGQGRGGESSPRQEDIKPRKDKSTVKCYNCQKFGHYAFECRSKKPEEEANLTSLHDEGPALMFAEGVANPLLEDEEINLEEITQESSKEEPEGVLLNEEKVKANLLASGEEYNHTNVWYLDNGASNHMTGFREKFNELDEKITGNVKFRDGSLIESKGRGTILFMCKNGDQRLITEVYYIPKLKSNIISLDQMTEEGNTITLVGSFLKMFDRNDALLMNVEKSPNRLYKVSLETSQPLVY
ncbi:uncharacterized protein LOC110036216 [Phalaenopsis equestris]|uniref:uncharacterized protein LOC110036216 n=1 Tax=Phalaenopsis equestris TaxID=78828 RepID=UPI0009E47A2E|nr:uncharacterized protein LOC110036216 [Phalaenopsis equestris]